MKGTDAKVELEILKYGFSICKVENFDGDILNEPFTFAARTDGECSLVCKSENVPEGTLAREDGWRCLRIKGTLDFSLTGILSEIAQTLARAKIPIFAVSTYDTDYIFVKENNLASAIVALKNAGYAAANEGE